LKYSLDIKKLKMVEKKQIDDTMLEYYGLTEEDLEKIKNEEDEIGPVNSKEMLLAAEIAEMFYLRFWVDLDLDEIILLIRKNNLLDKQFKTNFYKSHEIYSWN